MFKIIRCGDSYDLVIAVTPHTTTPKTAEADGAKFYRYLNDARGKTIRFTEITYDAAMRYFSGQADGLGIVPPPAQTFDSLEAVVDWVRTSKAPILSARHVQSLRTKIARRKQAILKAQKDIAKLENDLAMILRNREARAA